MVAMVLGCGAVAWTVGGPVEVALAFWFCFVLSVGWLVGWLVGYRNSNLLFFWFGRLLPCSLSSIRNRDVRLIVGRYRWFYVGGVWII
jgi:hypothetical protein